MRNARVGIIGKPFEGMGDFIVPEDELEVSIGIRTFHFTEEMGKVLHDDIPESAVKEEMQEDRRRFICRNVSDELLSRVARADLMVRKWIEKESLSAFTVNFLDLFGRLGIPAMPFLEAGKAMARGIGYAGEGDILTAALVGALASVYPEVSFTEMFCPDWMHDSVMLSHMGEMNLELTSSTPVLMEKEFTFTDVGNTTAACGCFKPGRAVVVDLAPAPGGSFVLTVAPGEMLEVRGTDRMEDTVHGWFKPSMGLPGFLEEYSRNGGTHHIVLVYGDFKDEMIAFGRMMSWKTVEIG
jgi:L-arabinose isomerase